MKTVKPLDHLLTFASFRNSDCGIQPFQGCVPDILPQPLISSRVNNIEALRAFLFLSLLAGPFMLEDLVKSL